MGKLLLKAGADTAMRRASDGMTVSERLLFEHNPSTLWALKILLDSEEEVEDFGEIIHKVCDYTASAPVYTSPDSAFWAVGRLQECLASRHAAKHINTPDQKGRTLLHKGAFSLSHDCVRLLLDAGADASIPFSPEPGKAPAYFPLQIACLRGWLLGQGLANGNFQWRGEDVVFRAEAMFKTTLSLVRDLTQWHRNNGRWALRGSVRMPSSPRNIRQAVHGTATA